MSCLSLGFLQTLLVNIIVIVAIVACIKLLVPWLVDFSGIPILGQVVMIILWAIIAIMVVYLIFGLLSCMGGLRF